MEFKEKLKQLRIQKGLTQAQLAEKLGVSNKTISKWETGTMPRYFIHVVRMGKVFNDKEFIKNLSTIINVNLLVSFCN